MSGKPLATLTVTEYERTRLFGALFRECRWIRDNDGQVTHADEKIACMEALMDRLDKLYPDDTHKEKSDAASSPRRVRR